MATLTYILLAVCVSFAVGADKGQKPVKYDCTPVPGVWTRWGAWADCSITCISNSKKGGNGVRLRYRYCSKAKYGAKQVCKKFQEIGKSACVGLPKCPVNCGMFPWGKWSACTKTCGSGVQHRARRIRSPGKYCGTKCSQYLRQTRTCNTKYKCPIHCQWGEWKEEGKCSRPCCVGKQKYIRKRKVIAKYGGKDCLGLEQKYENCNIKPCPVDCVLSGWYVKTDCRPRAKNVCLLRQMARSIIVKPAHGGDDKCEEVTKWVPCKPCRPYHPPNIDCRWDQWKKDGGCTRKCGSEGLQHYTRYKIMGKIGGGKKCPKPDMYTKSEKCNHLKTCPPYSPPNQQQTTKKGDEIETEEEE